jgi:hypothetical protein
MWYGEKKLDYSQPVVAVKRNKRYLLLPQVNQRCNFETKGYDWFDINSGEWNSCLYFSTPEAAINSYASSGYKITNARLDIFLK